MWNRSTWIKRAAIALDWQVNDHCSTASGGARVNRALFDAYVQSANELGFDVAGEYTGESADSGFTSAVGTPTTDARYARESC